MRFSKPIIAGLVSASLVGAPAVASHNDHDHTSNVRLVSSLTIDWPFASDSPVPDDNSGASVFYPGDLAFQRRLLLASPQGRLAADAEGRSTESGLALFRIARDRDSVQQLGAVRCLGVGDVSVWGRVAIQGVVADDYPPDPENRCVRDGLRIYDIRDPAHPRVVAFRSLECGTAGFNMVKLRKRLYVYAPSGCHESLDGPNNAGAAGEIFVYEIDPRRPRRSRMVGVGNILPQNGCGGTSVHAERRLLVCVGDMRFVTADISDPPNPELLTDVPVTIPGATWWITATAFSWDGRYLAIGLAGGEEPGEENPYRIQVWDVEDPAVPQLAGTWNSPKTSGFDSNAYSVTFLPMKDERKIVLVAQGNRGVRLVDFTDPSSPREVAHYIPMDTSQTYIPLEEPSNVNAAYWYNGRIYAADMDKIHVFRVRGFDRRTVHFFRRRHNPQTQIEDFR